MSVAMSSTGATRHSVSRKPKPATGSDKVTPISQAKRYSTANERANVKVLSASDPIPLWVRSLMKVQRSSALVALVLVSACLSIYGWTVYYQQMWNQEARKLDSLRRHEQQLAAANELLKHEVAQQAERPGSNLVAPKPENLVFLEPTPPRYQPSNSQPSAPGSEKSLSETMEVPLGY